MTATFATFQCQCCGVDYDTCCRSERTPGAARCAGARRCEGDGARAQLCLGKANG